MLSKKMLDALNGQINAELYSAYLYLSMASYFESVDLPGFSKWMRVQATEETAHAMKLFDYVVASRGRVTLRAVDAPKVQWSSALDAFEDAFKHELKVTGLIKDLVTLAEGEKDHATVVMLQWFVTEQVEEEASADEVVQKLKMAGESPNALMMLDQVMAKRQ